MSHAPLDDESPSAATDYANAWKQTIDLIETGGSWSGRERNCCFLNLGAGPFADVSAVTGLDFDDDGRSAAVVDWDFDGDLDLWLGNRTSPRLRYMQNGGRYGNRFVAFRLRGTRCNGDGIGARLEVILPDERRTRNIRTVRAGEGFQSQSSGWIHFGLGEQSEIERLVVRWPGGDIEEFDNLKADRHYDVVQGAGLARPWQPPRVPGFDPSPSPQKPPEAARLVLDPPLPLPESVYQSFSGQTADLPRKDRTPTLVNLWATWCLPCRRELQELAENKDALNSLKLNVVALSVDRLNGEDAVSTDEISRYLDEIDFPFPAGLATDQFVDKLDVMHDALMTAKPHLGDSFSLPVPTSLLLDRFGRIRVFYKGAVTARQLLADAAQIDGGTVYSTAGGGRWFWNTSHRAATFLRVGDRFLSRGYLPEAERYAALSTELIDHDVRLSQRRHDVAALWTRIGKAFRDQNKREDSERSFRRALECSPNDP